MNQASSPAAQLKPHQRQKIALRVLTKQETIRGLAEDEGVGRKFLYKKGHIAHNALILVFGRFSFKLGIIRYTYYNHSFLPIK